MSSDPETQALRHAYDRVRQRPDFIASSIAAWQNAFARLPSEALNTDDRTVLELGLCMRPRSATWLMDVREIAEAVSLEVDVLITFLRAAEAVEIFSDAPMVDDKDDGRLLAARDLSEDDEE